MPISGAQGKRYYGGTKSGNLDRQLFLLREAGKRPDGEDVFEVGVAVWGGGYSCRVCAVYAAFARLEKDEQGAPDHAIFVEDAADRFLIPVSVRHLTGQEKSDSASYSLAVRTLGLKQD